MCRTAMSMALVSSENQVTGKLNFPLSYRRHINQASLIYIYCYREQITLIVFIFAYIEKYPYFCLKRKEETL